MKLDRATILYFFKSFSFLCFTFVAVVFINVIFNDDIEVSYLVKIKQNKDEVNKFNMCKFEKNKLLDFDLNLICEKQPSNFNYVLPLSENKYIYYLFALVLGGVLNSKIIVKIGIF